MQTVFLASILASSLATFLILGAALPAFAADPDPYYGKGSYEAILSFDHRVVFTLEHEPTDKEVREEIADQVMHLFGPLTQHSRRAIPKGDEKITQIRVSHSDDRYVASYHSEGHIIVQGAESGEYRIMLPIVPDEIYEKGVVRVGGKKTYPCTDKKYHHEDEFWYFWNPFQTDCPLREGVDFERLTADLRVLPNTDVTYPEYARLRDAEGTIRIDMLLGMDDEDNDRNPDVTADISAAGYLDTRRALVALGYDVRRLSDDETLEVTGTLKGQLPWVEEFTRRLPYANVVVRLFFGPSGMEEDSRAFHYFFRDALKNAAVMIYDGHSGLSEYLEPAGMEKKEGFKLAADKSRYQIYFFNSCSSYPYYNELYFAMKQSERDPKGTKNLDILTNGLATDWEIPHETDLLLVRAIDRWAETGEARSYQSLIDEIDSGNLAGVNGDEDNDR